MGERAGSTRLAVLWIAISPLGCMAKHGEPIPSGTEDRPRTAGDPGMSPSREEPAVTNGPDASAPIPPFAPAEASLHRLTRRQYEETIRDLFEGRVHLAADLEVDTPLHGFSTVGASSLAIGPRAAEQYEAAAIDIAAQVFRDEALSAQWVGCSPASADDPCVRTFVTRFGRKAWRRALTEEEIDRWMRVASEVGTSLMNPWAGVALVVVGLLQSPHFLYRVEVGEQDPTEPGRFRYTGYEMATRLSYFLWNSTPDDELLGAAEIGALLSREGVEREARRLLASPKAKSAITAFFAEHFKLDRLLSVTKDPLAFPQISATLLASMRVEIERMIEDVVFERDVDLREIFSTNATFVNAELARLYNMATVEGSGFERVEFPSNGARSGILTTAGFLALNAHATITSPTYRGRFIRQSLLCQPIEPPPPGVTTTLPDADPAQGPRTLRQRLEALHLTNPVCARCHGRMDPLGFGLENFDAIGAYRTTDNGLPIDPRGTLDGAPFRNARELSLALKDHPDLAGCMSRMAYRYATAHLETDGEARVLSDLTDAFERSGFRFRELVVALVTSDGFRFLAPPVGEGAE